MIGLKWLNYLLWEQIRSKCKYHLHEASVLCFFLYFKHHLFINEIFHKFFNLKRYELVFDCFVPEKEIAVLVFFEFLKLLEEELPDVSHIVFIYVVVVVSSWSILRKAFFKIHAGFEQLSYFNECLLVGVIVCLTASSEHLQTHLGVVLWSWSLLFVLNAFLKLTLIIKWLYYPFLFLLLKQ